MEKILKDFEYKVSGIEDNFIPQNNYDDAESILDKDIDEVEKKESEISDSINLTEDTKNLINKFFNKRDFILNENWDVSENIQGKIFSIDKNQVNIDCLIDVETKSFQIRSFPKALFKNIRGLKENSYVIIKVKMKPGSTRIDVFPGDGIVNKELFNIKHNWESLQDSGLDQKLTKW